MTTFIMKGKYSAEAIKQISSERTTLGNKLIQQCGGKFVTAYATLGESDLLLIAEFPGVSEAIKASIVLNEATGISFSTVPALQIEEFDRVMEE